MADKTPTSIQEAIAEETHIASIDTLKNVRKMGEDIAVYSGITHEYLEKSKEVLESYKDQCNGHFLTARSELQDFAKGEYHKQMVLAFEKSIRNENRKSLTKTVTTFFFGAASSLAILGIILFINGATIQVTL
ncbi:hypothetical protein AB832_08395 [Flavobacteriaceae bacterium (ex Bugula neritina AB1)]|jgi:hypothetical protein|nr:hypothetical protein AB832_08395 [Flavobacteriaceae bacterium (ex Bugula neritina AB1)]